MIERQPLARLVVTEPASYAGTIFEFSEPSMLIGREEAADFVLDDEFVSRHHARVTTDSSGQVIITDLNSVSGTFVNDERLTGPRVLRPGDMVRIADVVARFEAAYVAEEPERRTEMISRAPAVAPVPERAGSARTGGTGGGGSVGAGIDDGDAYTVAGVVSSPVSPVVGVLAVALLDCNAGVEPTTLATTSTADDGRYTFDEVVISGSYLQQHLKAAPDMQVQVSAAAAGAVLASSAVQYSAPTKLTVDVVLPSTAIGLPSEWEHLTAKLGAVYSGSLAELKEDDARQDITYLANRTGWDARAVALAAIATQFSQMTAPPPTRPAGTPAAPADAGQPGELAQSTMGVAPELFYALFRAGLPTDADRLFGANSARVQAIWQQAAADNVIPQTAQSQIPTAVSSFRALAAAHVLTAAPTLGVSTLQQMLAPILPEDIDQQQFAQIYAQYQGDWDSLWPAVSQAFGAEVTAKLQVAGQLHYLTINNAPLLAALHAQAPITKTLDLVAGGYYSAEKWTSLIGTTAVPPQISGSTPAEQAANYAEYLAAQLRLAHPTAVLADQVKNHVMSVTGDTQVTAKVAQWLTTHQDDFQVGAEPVDTYTARTQATIDPAARAQVKRLQRAYQLTPDDTSMAVLLRHNLDSAYALTRYDTAGFVRAFATKLGGEATATAIHRRAKQIFSSTLNIAISYLKARTGRSIGGATTPSLQSFPPRPNTPGDAAEAATPDTSATGYPQPAFATLEDLFGSLDYCCCSDCSSILSPAAYLVDLLNYLDQPAPSAGGMDPQTVLLGRRPDLQYLPLTCANTNTEMPYIDLVNETLEYLVSNGLSISGYEGQDTPAELTSAELIAAPQYVDDTAYMLLQRAYFPPPLPFNRPLMLLRAHLNNLGISLPATMTTLLPDPPGTARYGWTDICIEQLGISRDEYVMFTDYDLATNNALPPLGLGDLYGIPVASPTSATTAPTPLQTLQQMNLQDFSRRVNVSYVDLTAIIQTQFINPNATLIPRLQHLNATFATLQQLHDNQLTTTQFATDLPAGLDFSQYLTATNSGSPTAAQTVVDWVNNKYAQIMDLIVIANLDNDLSDCSGTNYAFQYANPDTTANTLSSTDFLKLIRFIRLWAKLAPVLGNPDDAVTIEQTDDILSALYPGEDLPPIAIGGADNPSRDAADQVQLDTGFATLLTRAGVAIQTLDLLSLTADQGLARLLACWAPIQTYGANALYAQLFLTPTLLQQDPGPQIATVAPSVGVGDQLSTSINGTVLPIGSSAATPDSYVVTAADTTPTSGSAATMLTTATNVATNIATAINACTASDPAWGEVALNSRFYASSQQNVITITAGVTITCAPPGTYGPTTDTPLSTSATVTGTPTPSDVLITTIDGIAIPYTVLPGDTPATIAAGIAAAVNATTTPDSYGPPLNQLLYANATGATIEFAVLGAGAPFTLSCTDISANTGSYIARAGQSPVGTFFLIALNSNLPVHAGDTYTTVIDGNTLTYTAGSGETASSVAQEIIQQIQEFNGANPWLGVSADLYGGLSAVIALDSNGAGVGLNDVQCSCSGAPGQYSFIGGPFQEWLQAEVSGSIPAGSILTTTINGVPLAYQVQTGQGTPDIATGIVDLINNYAFSPTDLAAPLTTVILGEAAGIAVFDGSTGNTPQVFSVGGELAAGGYTAGRGRAPFADDGYGDYLPEDTTQTLFAHEAALCAATNITGADFAAITSGLPDNPWGLGYTPTTLLTLDNVTEVFRRGWLAQALSISVLEFLQLRYFTGIDPFTIPDPDNAPAAIVTFTELAQALNNAGIIPAQALYLMWNQDNAATYTPPPGVITGLAAALITDFAAVDAQFVMPPGGDPDGSIAANLMTLVYGSAATDTFFGLLNNTFTSSISYSVPPGQNSLPATVLTAGSGPSGQRQLSYNNLTKQLSFAGVLFPAGASPPPGAVTVDAIDAAIVDTTNTTTVQAGADATFTPASMANISTDTILVIDSGDNQETVTVLDTTATTFTANTAIAHIGTFPISNDPNLKAGVTALATANQRAVNQFFAAYPELRPLYNSYLAPTQSTQSAQDIRTALLQQLLPVLKTARKSQQALTTAASTAGVDPSFAATVLNDPTVLHTDSFINVVLPQNPPADGGDADPTAAAFSDLISIENQGLTAHFYLDNDPSGPADQTINPQPPPPTGTGPAPLSYAQTATVGTVSVGDILHTTINGIDVSPPYTVTGTDTAVTAAAGIAAAINACTQSVPTSTGDLPINQVVTASSSGPVIAIAGRDPSGANGVFTLETNLTGAANPTNGYTTGTQLPTAPTGPGPDGIAAVWSGYLAVPQDGSYDINIATDEGAQIILQVGGTAIPGDMSGTMWSNTAPIALISGSPIPITLTATSIKTTFAVSWTSQGLGWQPIPTANLYAFDYLTQLGNTYTRFLKAAALASALSLTPNELAYLATGPGSAVNTTCAHLIAPGAAVTLTPASMANIATGSQLLIDTGVNLEASTVATTTDTTFTTVITKTHDGTTTPFTVISRPAPHINGGWLNFLNAQNNPTPAIAASLTTVLTALLDYTRIKQNLSPGDERLLTVLRDPTANVPGVLPTHNALQSLTGWSLPSLNALLTHFFPSSGYFPVDPTTGTVLSTLANFGRIYDAYGLVTASGLSAANLISSVTNAPSTTTVAALQSALRALYAESDWLTVIGPINDTARIQQRDALVAYIVQQLGDAYANSLTWDTTGPADLPPGFGSLYFAPTAALQVGMQVAAGNAIAPGTTITEISAGTLIPGGQHVTIATLSSPTLASIPPGTMIAFAPAGAIPITDSDTLYDLLLVDTQTQPPVLTSRIRQALSIVQLFVERILRNLEPLCATTDIDAEQWSWMKSYRVWQANREVFLWPENWADPQLRDDQSPFFQQMMTSLQQGDITDDAATTAYMTYLTSLEEVAKLEPCGIYYVPGSADTDETTYVVARTAGARRKYYFRELSGGAWTPWTEVGIDCEEHPLTPVVWNGRLFLFWLKAIKQVPPPTAPVSISTGAPSTYVGSVAVGDLTTSVGNSLTASANAVTATAALCWSEYYNGAWQQPKTSDLNLTTTIGGGFAVSGSGSFDIQRGLFRLVPLQNSDLDASLNEFPADSLVIAITDGNLLGICGGFMLHNTHSLPIRLEDIVNPEPMLDIISGWLQDRRIDDRSRNLPGATLYNGASVNEVVFTIDYGDLQDPISVSVLSYGWQSRWVDCQPALTDISDIWSAPFLYEDRQAQFYATTTVSYDSTNTAAFGKTSAATQFDGAVSIPRVITSTPPTSSETGAGNAATGSRDRAADSNIANALSSRTPVTYQGRVISLAGSTDRDLPGTIPHDNDGGPDHA